MSAVQYQKPQAEATLYSRERGEETGNTTARLAFFKNDPSVAALMELVDGAVTGKGKKAVLGPTSDWGRKYSDDEEPDWRIQVDTLDGSVGMRPGDWLIRGKDNMLRVLSAAEYEAVFG